MKPAKLKGDSFIRALFIMTVLCRQYLFSTCLYICSLIVFCFIFWLHVHIYSLTFTHCFFLYVYECMCCLPFSYREAMLFTCGGAYVRTKIHIHNNQFIYSVKFEVMFLLFGPCSVRYISFPLDTYM